MTRTPFGITKTGEQVEKITLGNDRMSVSVLSLGAILQEVRLTGHDHPLCLGATTVAAYQDRMSSYGSIIGPVVNRITNATLDLDGVTYPLEPNQDGTHTLHTGAHGTHRKVWAVAEVTETAVTLTLDQPHLIDGLPGNRRFTLRYILDGPALTLDLHGTTDAPTVMNFAHHPYWNLDGTPTFAGYTLQVAADHYLPTTPDNRPTGEVAKVDGTDFDFRTARSLTADNQTYYDHNLCLGTARTALRDVATLTGTKGIALTIATTEPGLQIYDGATINTGEHTGHRGQPYAPYEAVALEPQFWPDAPTHADFPSIRLDPNATYHAQTRYSFAQT